RRSAKRSGSRRRRSTPKTSICSKTSCEPRQPTRSRNRSSSRPRSSADSPAASSSRGCDLPTALARPLARLIDELSKLPGVGPKTAQRLAYHILRTSSSDAEALAAAVRSVKTDLRYCATCVNIAETDPCAICDATAMYIAQLTSGNGVRVTRLARGLPMGGDLEWADEVTVSRALEGRRGL